MRRGMSPVAVVALALLAGCFQAEAPPPAAARSDLQGVQRLADRPDGQTVPKLAAIARDDGDPAVRQEALYAIADIGTDADAPVIAQSLRDPDSSVRIAAIDVLSTMDGEAPAALLIEALNDPDPAIRLRAVDALGDIEGPMASAALQQALGDADAGVRAAAGELLEEPGR